MTKDDDKNLKDDDKNLQAGADEDMNWEQNSQRPLGGPPTPMSVPEQNDDPKAPQLPSDSSAATLMRLHPGSPSTEVLKPPPGGSQTLGKIASDEYESSLPQKDNVRLAVPSDDRSDSHRKMAGVIPRQSGGEYCPLPPKDSVQEARHHSNSRSATTAMSMGAVLPAPGLIQPPHDQQQFRSPAVFTIVDEPKPKPKPESERNDVWVEPISFEIVNEKPWDPEMSGLPTIPALFPEYMLDLGLPRDQYENVLKRVPKFCSKSSIQGLFTDKPVSARLATKEGIELFLQMFESQDKQTIYIMVQRRKGDALDANNYVRKLLAAIQEDQESEIERASTKVSDQSFPDAESFINSLLAGLKDKNHESSTPSPAAKESDFIMPQSPKVILMHSIDSIYNALSSKRLSVRRAGLEMLSINTSIERTLSSTSIPCAVIVLTGKQPFSFDDYVDKCVFIHSTVIRLISKGEFLDGFDLIPTNMDVDNSLETATFPSISNSRLPPPYAEFMLEVTHLALNIFANSIEVVSTLEDKLTEGSGFTPSTTLEGLIESVFRDCKEKHGVELYAVLLDFIREAQSNMANGALACQTMYLMAKSFPRLREVMVEDKYSESIYIGKAIGIGRARHADLEKQSEALWDLMAKSVKS